jgi:nitrite reductase (NADH) small subunit
LEYRVGSVEELRDEGCRVIEVQGRRIGVLSVDGRIYAVRNQCPHMGAPLCEGRIGGTFLPSDPHDYVYGMDNRVIRCPWHGWEFDLTTGRSLLEPDKVRVKVYPVTVEDGVVILHV